MVFEEWVFLDEWCGAMRELFVATKSTATVWQWGPDYNPALQFTIVPPRDEELSPNERSKRLQILREGLTLFAAVAWVNVDALISLLKSYNVCEPREETPHHDFMMTELPIFVELDVTQSLCNDPSKASSWIRDDLVALCCQLDEHNTSEAFQTAWAKVEELSGAALRGMAIPVRVIICKPDYYYLEVVDTASPRVWDVVKSALNPEQVQWGWFSSVSGRRSTLAKQYLSSLYASAVVDSVNAKNEFRFRDTSAMLIKLLSEMAQEVQFSALSFCISPRMDSQTACRMITNLFCGDIRPKALTVDQRGVDHAGVSFRDARGMEIRALCSALAVTSSCRSVTFALYWGDSYEATDLWMWMVYACFSNRARSRSSVKRVAIYDVRLASKILGTMSRILTASNSEQELFAATKGLEIASSTALDAREYHLREKAVVRVTEEATGRVVSWNPTDIFQKGEVSGVMLVNSEDDGSTEWVDVLVPGIGLCQVQRNNLVVCDHVRTSEVQPDLALELQFSYALQSEPLTAFLRLVGKHLRSLWLDVPVWSRAVDFSGIFDSCPHLQELTIRYIVVSTGEFVQACRQYNPTLRHLECRFDDLGALAAILGNDATVLARTLRCWHLSLRSAPGWAEQAALRGLTQMLTSNKVLQDLTVAMNRLEIPRFEAGLRQFQLEEVDGNGELPVESKLAFLSIFQLSEAGHPPSKKQLKEQVERFRFHAPDDYVTTKIFEFAAKHAVRRVNIIPDDYP